MSLAKLMARAGWNVIAIDLLHFGERATDLLTTFTDAEKDERLYSQSAIYFAWMTQSVRDTERALDLLLQRTDADASRIALVGQSRGGLVGFVAAGLDQRFSRVALLFAGHGRTTELDHLAAACPANYVTRIAPRPLLMVNSDRDESMTGTYAVQPMFNLAGEPKELIKTNGGHMAMTEADIATVMAWLTAPGEPKGSHYYLPSNARRKNLDRIQPSTNLNGVLPDE